MKEIFLAFAITASPTQQPLCTLSVAAAPSVEWVLFPEQGQGMPELFKGGALIELPCGAYSLSKINGSNSQHINLGAGKPSATIKFY